MGKFKSFIIFILSFLFIVANVNAASCGYEEKAKLNSEVSNVKANYEIKIRVMDPGEFTPPDAIIGTEDEETYQETTEYMQVNILNITENMYVEVTNNFDNTKTTYQYQDTNNGNIVINWSNLWDLVTYTIKVYASSNTGCVGTPLRTLYVSLPRYNDYSELDFCTKVPDYYLCQRYVTYNKVEFDEFYVKVTEEIAKKENKNENDKVDDDKWYQSVSNFVVKHKVAFIIGGISLVVVAGGVTYIIIRKRRRSII